MGFRSLQVYERALPELGLQIVSEAVCDPSHVRQTHTHEVLELIYVLSGRMIRSVGGHQVVVGPGAFFINPPHEEHGAAADPAEPPHIFTVAVDPALMALRPGMDLGLASAQAGALVDLDPLFDRRAIPGGHGAEVIFRRLLEELGRLELAAGRRRELGIAQVQALLVELFVFVARCALGENERRSEARAPEREDLRRLLAWLETRLSEPPALADMAARAGLSPAHFTVVFRRELGVTPLEYLTTRRIDAAARALLSAGASITKIAHDHGFSSSQYFSLVFRKVKGCTPRTWKLRGGR